MRHEIGFQIVYIERPSKDSTMRLDRLKQCIFWHTCTLDAIGRRTHPLVNPAPEGSL